MQWATGEPCTMEMLPWKIAPEGSVPVGIPLSISPVPGSVVTCGPQQPADAPTFNACPPTCPPSHNPAGSCPWSATESPSSAEVRINSLLPLTPSFWVALETLAYLGRVHGRKYSPGGTAGLPPRRTCKQCPSMVQESSDDNSSHYWGNSTPLWGPPASSCIKKRGRGGAPQSSMGIAVISSHHHNYFLVQGGARLEDVLLGGLFPRYASPLRGRLWAIHTDQEVAKARQGEGEAVGAQLIRQKELKSNGGQMSWHCRFFPT